MNHADNHRSFVDPSALRNLLSTACLILRLPALNDVQVGPAALGAGATARGLQDLLDQVLIRHDELVVLAHRLGQPGPYPCVPPSLRVVLEPTVEGCLEATRTFAGQLRVLIGQRLELCMLEST